MKNNGVGFLGFLGLIFITLKLTEIISWSWWLVLLPLYALPVGMALIVILIITADVLRGR